MPVTDQDAALAAVAALDALSPEQSEAHESINAILRNGEPFVDVHELFALYNVLYFQKLLLPRVQVIWSPRLTLCAGICELSKDPQTGRFTRVRLKLSTPLLQYRPRSDTINTLLHESIHAYFFITTSWKHSRGDDGTGHGAGFQLLADAVNNHGNYKVTIYHTFHDEVDSYRTHIWQCHGPCKHQPPYFGQVKRSMNRAPGNGDTWYSTHEAECGGVFEKVHEPAPTKKQWEAMSTKERAGRQKNKLDGWIKKDVNVDAKTPAKPIVVRGEEETSAKSSNDDGHNVASLVVEDVHSSTSPTSPQTGQKRPRVGEEHGLFVQKKLLVDCPICSARIAESDINRHLDVVHS